jgi:hypothetical protein
MTRTYWAPKAVSRPTPEGYTFLVLRVEWDTKRDILGFTVDGNRFEWYRRGTPLFDSWAEGCAHVRKQGWPCN